MLLVKIWLDSAARSGEDSPTSSPLGRGSVTDRYAAGQGRPLARVAPGPGGGQEHGTEQKRRGEQQGELALDHQPPVVALDEPPERPAPRRRVVDEMASPPDEALEIRDRRIAGETATSKGEIGSGAAVAPAQQEDARRPKLLRPPAGAADKRLELLPGGAALAQKSVYVHRVEFEDTMTITTPEGIDLQLSLAGLGSRFSAALVDLLIQGVLIGGVAVVLGSAFALRGWGLAGYMVAVFVVFVAYNIVFEVLASGRTPGKRLNGLRVARVGGFPVGFLASAIRNTFRLVDIAPERVPRRLRHDPGDAEEPAPGRSGGRNARRP